MFQEIKNLLTSTNNLPDEINEIVMNYVGTPESVKFEFDLKEFKARYAMYCEDMSYAKFRKRFNKTFYVKLANYLNISNIVYDDKRISQEDRKKVYFRSIIMFIKYVLKNKIEPVKNIYSKSFYQEYDDLKDKTVYFGHWFNYLHKYRKTDYRKICNDLKIPFKKSTSQEKLFNLIVSRIKEKEDKARNNYNNVIQQITN